MKLIDKVLGPNSELAALVTELFEQLPDAGAGASGIDSTLWNRALLDPARDILSRSGKGFRARLTEHCFALASKERREIPDLLPVLIELLHVGSLVIDDIEDDSPMRRGRPTLHRQYGIPIALNTGNWFYFLPLGLLSRAGLDRDLSLALYEDISLALMRCHKGQALDLSINVTSLSQAELPTLVAKSTRLKTGSLMELAAVIGARAAGAPRVETFARFGADLGVGLQMLDDWSGIDVESRRHKGMEDLTLGRLTWPWAWLAQDLEASKFSNLLGRAQSLNGKEEASVLIEDMRRELKDAAPVRIREYLEGALAELRSELGPGADLKPLADDIETLRGAYD